MVLFILYWFAKMCVSDETCDVTVKPFFPQKVAYYCFIQNELEEIFCNFSKCMPHTSLSHASYRYFLNKIS